MVTWRSALQGAGITTAGIAAGYFLDSKYMEWVADMGSVPYFNQAARVIGDILGWIGYVGGPAYGVYHAFLSDAAIGGLGAGPGPGGAAAGAGPRIVNVRIGRAGRVNIGRP